MRNSKIKRLTSGIACLAFVLTGTPGACLSMEEPPMAEPALKMLPPAEVLPDTAELRPSSEDTYLLGPGDQLSIVDYSMADTEKPPTTSRTFILPDGTVNIYPLGVIRVEGMTLQRLNDLVNKKMGGTPTNPEVSIILAKTRPVSFHVLGDVFSPGIYTVEPGLITSRTASPAATDEGEGGGSTGGGAGGGSTGGGAVAAAPPKVNQLTLVTALQMAGGVRDSADITHIKLTRANTGKTYLLDLWRLLVEGDASQDLVIRDNDTIFVARGFVAYDASLLGSAVESVRRVRVFGAFKKPGIYDLRPDDDLFSVIARAGGFTEHAVTSQVILSRKNRTGGVETNVVPLPTKRPITGHLVDHGTYIDRIPVRNGDVVISSESLIKKAAPKTATLTVAAFTAVLLLYLSRRIVDKSQPANSNTSITRLTF